MNRFENNISFPQTAVPEGPYVCTSRLNDEGTVAVQNKQNNPVTFSTRKAKILCGESACYAQGGQDAPNVTSSMIKLWVGQCLTVPLHGRL